MDNKTLGIIIVIGLILYSEQEGSWIVSAIVIGIGGGIFSGKK